MQQNLTDRDKIVKEDGSPSDFFMRLFQNRATDHDDLESALTALLARVLTAGAGLTGGGSLAADRTFDVGAGTGIVANANDVAIDLPAEAERIRDTIGTALIASTGITIVVSDVGDTITISCSVTAYTDEMARAALSVAPTTVAASTYTLVLADAYEYIRLTNAAGCDVTVPPNATVAFPIGTTITFRTVTFASSKFTPGAGVTLNKVGGGTGTQTFSEIGATTQLKKVGTNEWDMIGGLL